MKTYISLVSLFVSLFCAAPQLSAQKVIADKTTSEGRTILTSEIKFIPTGDDEGSLNYFSHGDVEVFQLHIDFDAGGMKIREGYKMLLKQKSGNIMEFTCYSGESNKELRFIPFLWMYDVASFEDANYLLTREDVESIISDPVVKMRVEYHQGYFDLGLDSAFGSRLSSFIEKAYKAINKALQNNKTGLYDGF